MNITDNGMQFVLLLFKSPETEYNASSIAKKLGISPMGALKIAKRLENEDIIKSKEKGQAKFYKLNLESDYVQKYIAFLLRREAEQAIPPVRRWITDIRRIKYADCAVLFGSVLKKGKEARDIDVLFITDEKRFSKLTSELDNLNRINVKRIHPMYQTKKDLRRNIKKEDKPVLSALKGIVILGEEVLIKIIENGPS